MIPRAVLADDYTRDVQTGTRQNNDYKKSLNLGTALYHAFVLMNVFLLFCKVQAYAANIKDRKQTSTLLR